MGRERPGTVPRLLTPWPEGKMKRKMRCMRGSLPLLKGERKGGSPVRIHINKPPEKEFSTTP